MIVAISLEELGLFGLLAAGFTILGLLTAVHAVMHSRTSQASAAWAIALISFPYFALPLYWVFGRSRFHGYVRARRSKNEEIQSGLHELRELLRPFAARLDDERGRFRQLERLAETPFTRQNRVELLRDGEATFEAIFAAIEEARRYVLVQFYTVRDDSLGRELKRRLVARAGDGVRVCFLYDEIGSLELPGAYLEELAAAGVEAHAFRTTRGPRNRFQLNFRNHRKVVIVDGTVALVGGHNVGDEYLGLDPTFGYWRDTHVRLRGPAVPCVQLAFGEDWYWATGEVPDLDWTPHAAPDGDQDVLVLATGPADELETCGLTFVQAIHAARERLWIASPYFVLDHAVSKALQVAALRGVDVRVLIPERSDLFLARLAAFSYFDDVQRTGGHIHVYEPGFLHQKVILVDDCFATVGTANFDNRSIRLNFEITLAVADRGFAAEVERMLEEDFERSRLLEPGELDRRPFRFRLAVRIARLFAQIL